MFCFISTIGDDILGIWPKDVKKDHINCAHATSSTIVTGDDNGAVKLFKFPCPEADVRIYSFIHNKFSSSFSRRHVKYFMVIRIMLLMFDFLPMKDI
jgi:hypothetical protein